MRPLNWILALSFLLAPALSWADDIGTVAFGPSLDGSTNPKEFALGYEKTWSELALYTRCALLFESETNGYCSVGIGVHIETPSGLFTRATVGPAYVANIDDRISSHLNANIVFAVGAYQGPAFFVIELTHVSNAGAALPNLGSDHALAQIGWRFGKSS